MVGTPNFLAPEIATRKTHSFEADVWSLGALIYQCLVGKPPFDDQDVLSTLKRVANVRYVLPEGLSHEAKDLINRILQKDAKKRLTLGQIRTHPFFLKRQVNASRNSSSVGSQRHLRFQRLASHCLFHSPCEVTVAISIHRSRRDRSSMNQRKSIVHLSRYLCSSIRTI